MKKLSFEELSKLADSVTDANLLEQISGGTNNDCHDDPKDEPPHIDYMYIGNDTIPM